MFGQNNSAMLGWISTKLGGNMTYESRKLMFGADQSKVKKVYSQITGLERPSETICVPPRSPSYYVTPKRSHKGVGKNDAMHSSKMQYSRNLCIL